MFKQLGKNIDVVFERDPAVRSRYEVVFCYPGFHALVFYRLSHGAWVRKWYLLGRFISHVGRFLTGIEIHPGASIGDRLFIDHGMGVVIGETSEIGNNVTLYHGVTLGGISLEPGKRHPTLEDDVIVGAGAKVLGPITLGQGARIGSNAVVLKDVPSKVSVVGIPAKEVLPGGGIVSTGNIKDRPEFTSYGVSSDGVPDPVARVMDGLLDRVQTLSARIGDLENELVNREAAWSGRVATKDGSKDIETSSDES